MKGVKVIKWSYDEEPSYGNIKKRLDEEGLDYYSFVCAPGDFFGEHKHEAHEVRVVVEGEMEYGVGDKKFILGPGDRIEMGPEIIHTAKAIGNKKVVTFGAEK